MNATVAKLQSMSLDELKKMVSNMPPVSMEQKRKAWERMDTGKYDEFGRLIGDRCEEEDAY